MAQRSRTQTLTDDQLEQGRAALDSKFRELAGVPPTLPLVETMRQALAAAAPYLQLPWKEPNWQETAEIVALNPVFGSLTYSRLGCCYLLCEFVRRRNQQLLPKPKPADPRLETVIQALRATATCPATTKLIAQDILTALDEAAQAEAAATQAGGKP